MRRRRGRATANETSSVRRFVMDRGESRVRVMVRVGGGDVLRPARKRRKDPEVFENRVGRGGALSSHSSVFRRFVALSSSSSEGLRAAACAKLGRARRRDRVSRASDGRRARLKAAPGEEAEEFPGRRGVRACGPWSRG